MAFLAPLLDLELSLLLVMMLRIPNKDHPDKVVAPGVYPLVVDPIIVKTRLSKVLMDGGSSLNIIYLETLDLLGIDRGRLQPSAGGFHGVVPGKKALPVGRIDLPVCFGMAANFRKETLVDIWERNKELIRKRTDIGEHFTREIIQSIIFIFLPLGERVHLTNRSITTNL